MPTQTDESDAGTFNTCIDLPGEAVQCWSSNVKKVKVILRKHRDIVFNIQISKGAVYTLEAEYSDFYDPRAKKLIPKGARASFHDSEIMHVWVSRDFKGCLLLKSKGRVLGRYEPNVLDTVQHGSDPSLKPPPLIVTLNTASSHDSMPSRPTHAVEGQQESQTRKGSVATAGASSAASESDSNSTQSMHIVEIRHGETDIPREIAEYMKHGGEQTAIDTNGLLTRNWLLGQIVGAAAYGNDNKAWIKELFRETFYLQKVVHKNVGARWYIVFSGNPRLREIITAARYGVANTKVITITSGIGSATGLKHAAWNGAKGSFEKAGSLAVLATITLDVVEWLADYEQRDPITGKPKKDFFDLALKIGLDVAKAGISAAIATVAMAGIIAFSAAITTVALPVVGVIIGTVILSIAVGLVIDYVDKKTGASDKLNAAIRATTDHLTSSAPKDYKNYSNSIGSVLAQHSFGF